MDADRGKTRVLLADDHTIVREGLRALLARQPDIEVVGEAADGRAAVARSGELKPDVVVMDLSMPELNGVDALRQIVRDGDGARVLVLSMHGGEEYVRPAIRAGASGYLLKGAGLSDLVTAIEAVARGEAFFSPPVAAILLRHSRGENEAGSDLTPREREILQLVGEGKSSPDIARSLHLSIKTVEGHRSRIMAKLGAGNVAQLVRHAIRLGLVSPES